MRFFAREKLCYHGGMFIVEVIPLKRGSNIESLTYYSSKAYDPGIILDVPVRKSTVSAIVVKNSPVSAARTAVRAATFSLKKLPDQVVTNPLPPSLIETAKALQRLYPAHLGSILYSLLPIEVREGETKVQYTTPVSHADIRPEVDILEATKADRLIAYRSKIREVFAHRGSVLFVVPTSAHIDAAVEALSHGIEKRLVVFSPTLTKKKLQAAYASYYDLTNAKLIITTPAHAYLDRHDITHIIVDESRNKHYHSRHRPYLDHREVLKTLAKVTNRTITFGDLLPRAEEEYFRREELYATTTEQPKRINFTAKLQIIQQENIASAEKPFALFSDELTNALATTSKNRGQSFIYAARRGLAPVVVCIDCGHIFRCPDSGTPYSLFKTTHNGEEQRWFLSPVSGKRIHAPDTCTACGSWRLRERGIGIQHIHTELHHLLPECPVILFDHTTATTIKKARVLMAKFYDTRGAILLGTQMALPYIDSPVTTTAITSHDAARAIPSWRAEEEFFSLLLELREKTTETVYVQTRTEPDQLIEHATQGLVEQFYNDELSLRESLSYPPFSTFVLLSWQDTKDGVMVTEEKLATILAAHKPKFYSAPQSLVQKTKRFGLIRVPKIAWPDKSLIDILRNLPPSIKIEINPDRII